MSNIKKTSTPKIKIYGSLIIFIILFLSFYLILIDDKYYNNISSPLSPSPSSSAVETINNYIKENFNDNTIYVYKLKDINIIKLIENLRMKKYSDEIVNEYNCKYLINGGFYQTQKFIGLVKIDNITLSKIIKSGFYNGFVNIYNNRIEIKNAHDESSSSAFQSGPLLMANGRLYKDNIYKDDYSKRILLSQDFENNYSVIIITKLNTLEGPTLNQIPTIINHINTKYDLKINNLINLDGGSHSLFVTKDFSIKELLPAGMYLCIT